MEAVDYILFFMLNDYEVTDLFFSATWRQQNTTTTWNTKLTSSTYYHLPAAVTTTTAWARQRCHSQWQTSRDSSSSSSSSSYSAVLFLSFQQFPAHYLGFMDDNSTVLIHKSSRTRWDKDGFWPKARSADSPTRFPHSGILLMYTVTAFLC